MRLQSKKSGDENQIQKNAVKSPVITEYAERLVSRSEQKIKTQPPADSKNGQPPPGAGGPLVSVEVEILITLEERQEHRYGLGAAFCVDQRNCARAILLALNRQYHPLLKKALAERDHKSAIYFAALLCGAFIVCNRQRHAVIKALEQKLKSDTGHQRPAEWCPSHLAVADLLAASEPFARIATLPIYGPEAVLGQRYMLGTFSVRIPEVAAKEGWNTRELRKAPRKNTNEIKV